MNGDPNKNHDSSSLEVPLLLPSSEEGEEEPLTPVNDLEPLPPPPVTTIEVEHGQVQPPAYRDFGWAVLFYAQLVAVVAIAAVLGPVDKDNSNNDTTNVTAPSLHETLSTGIRHFSIGWTILLPLLVLPLLAAIICVLVFAALLTRYSQTFVRLSFWMTPGLFFVLAVTTTAADPQSAVWLWAVTALSLALAVFHFCVCRRSIPYTAAIIRVALLALQPYRGSLVCLSLMAQVLLCVWLAIAATALTGAQNYYESKSPSCMESDDDNCTATTAPVWVYILWGFSMYWTLSVVRNVLRATIAGAVGSWWFRPNVSAVAENETASNLSINEEVEEELPATSSRTSCCCCCCCCCCCYSPDVSDSLYRSLTFSFGSICLGSLLVALVQTLNQVLRVARHRQQQQEGRTDNMLLCVCECLLGLLSRLVDYFNAWAFCYVGLYGYDYCTAGKKVMTLLKARGWSSIIADRLLFRVFFYGKSVIGIASGGLVVILDWALEGVSATWSPVEDNRGAVRVALFFVAALVGLVLADVSFRILESAVRTILICFAESPADAALWHPTEFACLRHGWIQSYPDEWVHDLPSASAFVAPDEEEADATAVLLP